MVPALIETIKQAGLVLVSDNTAGTEEGVVQEQERARETERDGWAMMPEGVNGIMKGNGILRFNDSIDM